MRDRETKAGREICIEIYKIIIINNIHITKYFC